MDGALKGPSGAVPIGMRLGSDRGAIRARLRCESGPTASQDRGPIGVSCRAPMGTRLGGQVGSGAKEGGGGEGVRESYL